MKTTHTNILAAALLFTVVTGGIAMTSPSSLPGSLVRSLEAATATHRAAPSEQELQMERKALRLQERMKRRFGVQLAVSVLKETLDQRKDLLTQKLTVTLHETGSLAVQVPQTWDASPAAHPEWVSFSYTNSSATFSLDTKAINASLARSLPLDLPPVVDSVLLQTEKDDYDIERVKVNVTPSAGYELDRASAAKEIVGALTSKTEDLVLPIVHRSGTITVQKNGKKQTFTLLSTGRSDYRTSPWGRKENIRKAVDEQLQGVLIPQGQTFSFNQTLGGPITKSNGWSDSLIIVNGGTLEPAPGGGICQAATTAYRAALLAGLPIEERAPHSLYVHYYELFGVGLDATVFPGKQDLEFVNNTPGDLIVQTSRHDTEVEVQLYGIADGRSVSFEGPYFASTAPETLKVNNRDLRGNEIVWLQTVQYEDGKKDESKIVSAYGQMPGSISQHYLDARGIAELLSLPTPTVAMQ